MRDWSRLVYAFGDAGNLIHPRYEASERELEAGRPIALPKPQDIAKAPKTVATPPLDYAAGRDDDD